LSEATFSSAFLLYGLKRFEEWDRQEREASAWHGPSCSNGARHRHNRCRGPTVIKAFPAQENINALDDKAICDAAKGMFGPNGVVAPNLMIRARD
jgi:hypothetical protein